MPRHRSKARPDPETMELAMNPTASFPVASTPESLSVPSIRSDRAAVSVSRLKVDQGLVALEPAIEHNEGPEGGRDMGTFPFDEPLVGMSYCLANANSAGRTTLPRLSASKNF